MKYKANMQITRLVLVSVLLITSACSKIWIRPESNNATSVEAAHSPSPRYSKRSVSTVAGATIGAVTGLAIGASTGNAGEGFLLGTVAGGAAGAGIGTALQSQEAKLESQEEIVRQQDAVIKQQGEEIQELRKSVIDQQFPISSRNTSSLGSDSLAAYSGNPNAQPYSGPTTRARMAGASKPMKSMQRVSVNEVTLTQPVARMPQVARAAEPQLPSKPAMPARQHAPAVGGAMTAPQPQLVGIDGSKTAAPLPPAQEMAATTVTTTANTLPPAKQKQELNAPMAKPEASTPKPIVVAKKTKQKPVEQLRSQPTVTQVKKPKKEAAASTPKAASKSPSKQDSAQSSSAVADSGCGQASKEAKRGAEASSDADKLFYYRRAIRLCPSEPQYYVEVGKVYVTIGRTEDAQHEFNKALELDPENEAAQNELSMIMLGAAY